MKTLLCALGVLLGNVAGAMDYAAVFTAPPRQVPTRGMPDGPLLGNGDVGVVLAGPPESQLFYIGKNDFWRRNNAAVLAVGRLALDVPALHGASYRQEQDLVRAEVRGEFSAPGAALATRSWVDANTNLLLSVLTNRGQEPLPLSIQAIVGEAEAAPRHVADSGKLHVGREQLGGGRWYFDGQIGDLLVSDKPLPAFQGGGTPQHIETFDGRGTWHELVVPVMSHAVHVSAWIKIRAAASDANYIISKGEWNHAYSLGLSDGHLRWAINGVFLQTKERLPLGRWIHVAATFDGRRMGIYLDGKRNTSLGIEQAAGTDSFERQADNLPGRSRRVAVAVRLVGRDGLATTLAPGETVTLAAAVLGDLDADDCRAAARQLVAQLTPQKIDMLTARHRHWWADFWSRSAIEIPDKEIERRWYAALYVMGSCSRAGKVAPGLWGNWITTDNSNWHGDFHLNYNFQAPYYGVYGCNHADLSLPFYAAMNQSVARGRRIAAARGWKGIHLPVSIGPWGLCPEGDGCDWGQRSDTAFAALNFIWHYQYTQDDAFLRDTAYPYLREVADFWEDYLKFEGGRYVIYNDSIHEGSGPDFNPLLSLGLVRTLFANMPEMSQRLGVDADRRAKWQHILAHLSQFPVQERGGKTVFRYSECGMAWCDSNTLGIHHIFPAGAIGLDSDPRLLQISRDTIDAMHRWADYNGFSSWYTACARVGYNPHVILSKMRAECDHHSMPNLLLYYGGGGIESCGGLLAVNEMLLQSHDGVLRLFPCWPKDEDARFAHLHAVGAFLVSARFAQGQICDVTITSERGRTCTLVNPWPGKKVKITGRRALAGARITFATRPGEVLRLAPEE
jgi:alpha-L-fucosidase 2